MGSWAEEIHDKGYLSANKFVKFLKETCPEKAISYPTLLRMVDKGAIKVTRVGQVLRIDKFEISRYIAEGNRPPTNLAKNPERGLVPPPTLPPSRLNEFQHKEFPIVDFESSGPTFDHVDYDQQKSRLKEDTEIPDTEEEVTFDDDNDEA